MHITKKDFCPWQARVSVVSTTHSAASRRRRSGSLSGCPMGVEAMRSMNAEFFASLDDAADAASSATPMARRTSATDGWAGGAGAEVYCPGGARRRMMRRAGFPAAEAEAEARTARRGTRAVAPARPRW